MTAAVDAEIIVVGGGIAGTAAALEGARLGAHVTLVDPLEPQAGASRAGAMPLAVLRDVTLRRDPAASGQADLREFNDTIAERRVEHSRHRSEQLRRARVHVERSVARMEASGKIVLQDGRVLSARTVVLATGTRPRRPSTLPFDDHLICDCETLLRALRAPRTVVVLGAEEEGCEFACVLAALGAQVTLIERRRKLFRVADREILAHLHSGLRSAGVTVVNGDDLERVEIAWTGDQGHVRAMLSSGRIEVSDLMLVVAGRVANPPALGEGVDLALDERGFIVVDDTFQTSLPGVFAIGDLAGPPFRVGTALYQARAAIASALSQPCPPIPELPLAVHTIPQIAAVGLGQDATRMLGTPTFVGTAREEDLPVRGMSYDPLRLLKLTFDLATRKLLGVQIAGGAAAELIHLGAQLLAQGAEPEHIVSLVFTHPSQADAYRVAAAAAIGNCQIPENMTASRTVGEVRL